MRLGTRRMVAMTAWGLAAFLCGGYEALSHFHYVPSPPPDACGLVPAEMLDEFVPGHDGGEPHSGVESDIGVQNRACLWEPSDYFLGVSVWHVGFGRRGGPVRYGWPTPGDLGDESAYQFEGGSVTYSARVGATIAGIVGYAAVWSLETALARYEVGVLDQRSHHH